MFYTHELPRPRPAPRPPIYQDSTIRQAMPMRSQHAKRCGCGCGSGQQSAWLRLMYPYLKEYCDGSSVHCLRYLTYSKMQYFERIIWLLLLLATSICAIFVYIDLAELYNSSGIQTTIEDSMLPVFYIPFPAIGLCPRNRIDWQLLKDEAHKHHLGQNVSAVQSELFESFFTAAGEAHLQRLEGFASLFENASLAAHLSLLDKLNVSAVVRSTLLNCTDIFGSCNWRGKSYNCCDIFELQHTEAGLCWVFNSIISPAMRQRAKLDKYYPRRTSNYGEGTGLEVYLRINVSRIKPGKRGVYVMVMQPEQWSDDVRLMTHNTHSKISMVPRYTSTDHHTRSVSPSVRRCLFDDETHVPAYKKIPGLLYWKGNCRVRCHQEQVNALCKCTPSLFFPLSSADNFTDCKASEFKCLYEHRDMFRVERHALESEYVDNVYKDSMICDCLNSCTQLIFDRTHSSSPLDINETGNDLGSLHLDIFYQSAWFTKYQTRIRYTFVELLASFGGIIGLFLGASLLSGIELVYYFSIGLFLYLRGMWQRKRQDSQQQQQQQQLTAIKLLPHPQAAITVQFRQRITPNKFTY